MQVIADIAGKYLNEERVAHALRLGRVGAWRWEIDSGRLEWSDNLEDIHALPPGTFDGTVASFSNDVHPDDVPEVWARIQACIDTGAPYRAVYRTAPREGAAVLWIEASGGLVIDPDGVRALTGVCLDVTERVTREQGIARRLRQQQAIGEFGSYAFEETDLAGILDRAAALAATVLEVPLAKILRFSESADSLLLAAGVGWPNGAVGTEKVGIDDESQAGHTLQSQAPVVVTDLRTETRFSDSALLRGQGVRSGLSVVIAGSDTRPFGVFGAHDTKPRTFDDADVGFLLALANIVANSARHHQEVERQNLLLREMSHRSGNLLQVVNAIAAQTLREGADRAEALRSYSERLSSLSRANYLVARGGWTFTRFAELVWETLEPFRDRLQLVGRDVLLPSDLSFDLGLVLHELATNSAKYGSLGTSGGSKVLVRWTVETGDDGSTTFQCDWADPITGRAPKRPGGGFGRRLFTSLIEQKWSGRIEVDDSDGFCLRFEVPLPRAT